MPPLKYVSKLAFHLSLMFAAMQFTRLIFFIYNKRYFTETTLNDYFTIALGGFKFDATILVYANALFILFYALPFPFRGNVLLQRLFFFVFMLTNSIVIFMNMADVAYFPFSLRRTNASFFSEFGNDGNLLLDFWKYILSYWHLFLLFLAILYALYYIIKKTYPPEQTSFRYKWSDYLLQTGFFALTILCCVFAMRGTFILKSRPINVGYATAYTKRPQEVNLVLNTPFSIFFTFGNKLLPEISYFETDKKSSQHFNPVQNYYDSTSDIQKKNVVIIIVESLSREFVGGLNKHLPQHESYTPFLDSLLPYCYTSTRSFANGKKSIEGLPSVVASVPSLNISFVLTPYSGNNLNSLGSVLSKNGYSTSFYHGAKRGSMGFQAFMNTAKIEKYYGREDFADEQHFDGTWGIYDEEFLQYWAKGLAKEQQPFLSVVFTLSSHHPYTLPDRYKNVFTKGKEGIQNSIAYTDNALRLFFESAKKEPWFNNSIFVITGDHAATFSYHPNYLNSLGTFSTPVIFYTPDSSLKPTLLDNPIQQTDIFPTIIDYLNCRDSIVTFGQSVLDTASLEKNVVATCYSGLYQMVINDSLALFFDGKETTGLYNYIADPTFNNNLIKQHEALLAQKLPKLKAYIQQYNNRLRKNNLTTD